MDWLRLKAVTSPLTQIVTLDEAREHLRIDHDDDDSYVVNLIDTAAAFIEGPNGAGIALSPRQWRYSLDHLPRLITLDLCPVISVDSITVLGDEVDPSSYTVDLDSTPVRIVGSYLPTIVGNGGVKILFTAGYQRVPADLKQAALLLIGHFYQNREATGPNLSEIPFAVSAILNRYRAFG